MSGRDEERTRRRFTWEVVEPDLLKQLLEAAYGADERWSDVAKLDGLKA